MIIKEHREIKSTNDKSKNDEMPPLKVCSDVENSVDGKALIND
jgi:hypothetical protein